MRYIIPLNRKTKIKKFRTKVNQLKNELNYIKNKYENILDGIADALIIVDYEFIVQYMNKPAEKIFLKPDAILGRCMWDVEPRYKNSIVYPQLLKARNQRIPVNFELVGVNTQRCFEINAYPSVEGIAIIFRNVTNRKQTEKEMIRLDKLNLIGQMAAGISHEIRNPLTTVRGFLQLLSGKEVGLEYKEYFKLMIDELDRANSIITEYLSIAKTNLTEPMVQSLNEIILTILPLIEADARNQNMEVLFKGEDIPDLQLNEKEIRQLILNLSRNGLEAMSSGGVLAIETFNKKDYIVLSIKDQGSGIDPEFIDKLGTPFLTNKPEGTGLGLAICYSIAKRHNAEIKIDSCPNGTTFYVIFKLKQDN